MPSPVTHGLVGIVMAQTVPLGVSKRRSTVVFAVLSVMPDIDLLGSLAGIPWRGNLGHRGITHSVGVAVVCGLIGARIIHGKQGLSRRKVVGLTLLACAVAVSHGLLDAATSIGVGVGLLMPFFDERIILPVRPILVPRARGDGLVLAMLRMVLAELLTVWLPLFVGAGIVHVYRRLAPAEQLPNCADSVARRPRA
ncbi:MAG: metal-dependent hydrolase [bacterium]|nr:metal-dependent hydrolase [bacterium]